VLWLTLDQQVAALGLTVAVDGRAYVVPWPRVAFEVPADQVVHVAVYVQTGSRAYPAAVLLAPSAPPELSYRVSALGGAAWLG
jgi:hypothetical protein